MQRYLLKSIQTKLTTIVADRELSLVIEEKEDQEAIGLATYSNSESTVLSYTSIFENLWILSEIKHSVIYYHDQYYQCYNIIKLCHNITTYEPPSGHYMVLLLVLSWQ